MMMMMPRSGGGGGDLNLNRSLHANGDAVQEALKQAMIQHELVFRNQVRELHRLYWTQKNLMLEFCRKAAEDDKEQKEEKEMFRLPDYSSMEGSSLAQKTDFSIQYRGNSSDAHRYQQRDFNLQLPADEYIRNDLEEEEPIHKRLETNGLIHSGSAKLNLSTGEVNGEKGGARRFMSNGRGGLYIHDVIDLEESAQLDSNKEMNAIPFNGFYATRNNSSISDLGLSSRMWNCHGPINDPNACHRERLREQKPNCYNAGLKDAASSHSIDLCTQKQIPISYKPVHIDLNIAQDEESNHVLNTQLMFPSPSTSSSVHQGDLWKESNKKFVKESFVARQPCTYPVSNASKGKDAEWLFQGCQDSHPSSTQAYVHSGKVTENCWNHEYEAANKVHGHDSKDPPDFYRSTDKGPYSASDGGFQNGMSLLHAGLCEYAEVNAESTLGQPHSIMHNDSRRQDSMITFRNNVEYDNLHASVGSTNLPRTATGDSDEKQAVREGSEEDTVSSHAIARDEDHQDGVFEGCSVVKMSSGCDDSETTGLDTLSAARDEDQQGGLFEECRAVKMSNGSDGSETTRLDTLSAADFPSKEVALPQTCNDNTCDIEEPRPQGYLVMQGAQATEMNCTVVGAAETLISLSLENSACHLDQHTVVRLTASECEESDDDPQYLSNSFESITLKLPEVRNDECLLLPAKSTEEEVGEDACGVKLRRGRGLLDFQKDVLSGLVSLSRHEIREDLQTIGHDLRKKNRLMMYCWEDHSLAIRSRRSRLCSAGRRR